MYGRTSRRRGPLLAGALALSIGGLGAPLASGQLTLPPAETTPVNSASAALSNPRAVERFRVAAALANRALYDVAAAEWAALAEEFADDPLADRARLERGVCLFQLQRFDEARAELRALLGREQRLDAGSKERLYAHLGLAEYNLGRAAEGDERRELLDAALGVLEHQLQQFPTGPLAPQAAFYRAEALYAAGRLPAAAAAYQAVLDRFPAHPQRADALYALGVAQQEQQHFDQAAQVFARFVREFAGHPSEADAQRRRSQSLLALGQHLLEFGQAERAADTLTAAAALPRWSRSDEVLLALAESLDAKGDTATAIQIIDRLTAEYPQSGVLDWAYQRRGEYHAASQAWGAAAADFGRVGELFPHSALVPQATLARARVLLEQRELAATEALLDEILARYPRHELAADARLLRATVRQERGDFAGCVADVNAFLTGDPPRPQRSDALYLRGLSELGVGRPGAAADSFRQIIDHDPQYRALDRTLYDLAWAYQEAGDAERAAATFAKLADAHSRSPLAAEAAYRVGEGCYAAGDFAAAAKRFGESVKLATDAELRERAAHKLAWCHFERHDYPAAEQAFRQQLDGAPSGPLATEAQLLVAECRFQQEDFRDAFAAFAAALEAPTENESLLALAWLHAGQSAAQLEQWSQSLAWLDRAVRDFPNHPAIDEVRCERGDAHYHLGRYDEARQDFAAVAANDRGVLGARAELMLGKVLSAQHQDDEAVRTYFKVAYGYGDVEAPPPFHHWQAEALYEAARCLENSGRHDSAQRLFQELLDRYPASERAAQTRSSLKSNTRR